MTIHPEAQRTPGNPSPGRFQMERLTERRIAWLVLGLGALLRVWQFAFNRSLWLDEAYLASNFVGRDTWALLTEPLANGQAAPLGFLFLTKVCFDVLGGADWTLRVLPLMAGLATLPLASRVASQVWKQPVARLLFLGLVAFSPVLIYYTSEFKQYGGDVLVTLWAVWACVRFRADELRRSLTRLIWVGVVGVWLSHPSVFVLAAIGSILGVQCLVRRQWHAVAGLALVGLLWASGFAVHYVLGLKAMAANPTLAGFWTAAYAPWPPFDARAWGWFWQNGLGLVYLAFRHVGIAHHMALPAWTDAGTVALAVATLIGYLSLVWRQQWARLSLLLLPIAITLVASGLHVYPFRSRLILFLVPLIWMAVVTAIDESLGVAARRPTGASRALQRMAAGLAVGVSLAMMLLVAIPSSKRLAAPYNAADVKGAMAYIRNHRLPGDHLMINSWSHKAFAFYQDDFELEDVTTYIYPQTRNVVHDGHNTIKRICRAGEPGRTWLLLSHRFERRQALLEVVAQVAPIVDQWEGSGAGAYLVNLSDAPWCAKYSDASPS